MHNLNYPDDVNPNDPNAPWNEKEYVFTMFCFGKCSKCEEETELNDKDICKECDYRRWAKGLE